MGGAAPHVNVPPPMPKAGPEGGVNQGNGSPPSIFSSPAKAPKPVPPLDVTKTPSHPACSERQPIKILPADATLTDVNAQREKLEARWRQEQAAAESVLALRKEQAAQQRQSAAHADAATAPDTSASYMSSSCRCSPALSCRSLPKVGCRVS